MSLIKVKTGWKRLEGIDGWRAEFKTLLEEANAVASKEAAGPRLEVAAYLAGFIQESFPQSDDMDLLDDMARKLAKDVLEKTIEERLASIAARTAEYTQLKKLLDSAAERAQAAADSTRLSSITRLIEATTLAITSAKELVKSLDTGRAADQKVAALIDEAVSAVERLRSAIAKLV